MPVVAFWSGDRHECGQTLSMAAVATYMCVDHNYRTLMVNATFQNQALERCFWNMSRQAQTAKKLNGGKMDIASGAEGLVSAIASNKVTPEIVANFTKVVFKNRLDVLPGLQSPVRENHEKSLMLYKDLLNAANKYYDLVFVDVDKTLDYETTQAILNASHLIVYVMPPNLQLINKYIEGLQKYPFLQGNNIIPILAREDPESKYNVNNVARYIGYKGEMGVVPYNSTFMVAACEAGVAKFFLDTKINKGKAAQHSRFLSGIKEVDKKIEQKLKELQLMV